MFNPKAEDIASITFNRGRDIKDYQPLEKLAPITTENLSALILDNENACIELSENAVIE